MSHVLVLCGGFLLAVLWMDLMFDIQVLRYRDATRNLPEEVLRSMAAYYRRVTTDARPMNRAVGFIMFLMMATLLLQITLENGQRWVGVLSFPFGVGPVLLAALRVFPNAVRLGSQTDCAMEQSRLARDICRGHLLCLGGIVLFLAVQLSAVLR
jgi:hypothetical protein